MTPNRRTLIKSGWESSEPLLLWLWDCRGKGLPLSSEKAGSPALYGRSSCGRCPVC